MTLLDSQRKTIDAVLSIFETGKLPSPAAASTVTILPDGAGISFGLHQATDASGSLDMIVQLYIDHGGRYASQLDAFLDELTFNATTKVSHDVSEQPPWVRELKNLLYKAATEDPLMLECQKTVFDQQYWAPMLAQATVAGLVLPLSLLALYDTAIQSGPAAIARMRRMFMELPPSRGGDEKAWTRAYIAARHVYLQTFSSPKTDPGAKAAHERSVRSSSYRTLALMKLVTDGAWNLDLPLTVRGVKIV